MSASADRNLLFGIVALQFDFITREQLIAGMSAWVLAKHRPLADLLQEAGALSPGRRQLLEPLVAEHIQQHNNDPQQSLAAVSSLGSVKAELQQIEDRDLQGTLPHVAACKRPELSESIDPYATVAVGRPSSVGLRFRVLRPHAEGGRGVVQVANDEELNREVALKEIRPQFANDPIVRSRFKLEAEVTGSLEHPSIVPVYGLGTYPDGRPFYAMRFIRGDSLLEAIKAYHNVDHRKTLQSGPRHLQLRQLLGRFIDVCQAIQYAHDRGVLHRDLKPGNIMLGKYGETLVVDWGLAKAQGKTEDVDSLNEESALTPLSDKGEATEMGSMIGTLPYMSPEQAAGQLDILGPATDVFALGATLYHLLVGQPPYHDIARADLLKAVRAANFPAARTVDRTIPKALDAICQHAMAGRPDERYPSCSSLVTDVENWLADEPVNAYSDSWFDQLHRFVRRNRAMVLATATALIFITIISVVAGIVVDAKRREAERLSDEKGILARQKGELAERNELLAVREASARQQADRALIEVKRQREIAEDSLNRLEWKVYAGRIAAARTAWHENKAAAAYSHLKECRHDFRGWEHDFFDALFNRRQITLQTAAVRGLDFSPDGRYLVSVGWDGAMNVWQADTGEAALRFTTRAVGSAPGARHMGDVTSVRYSPDGTLIASGGEDTTLKLWNAISGELSLTLSGHKGAVTVLAFSANGSWIVSGSNDGTLKIWNCETGRLNSTLEGHSCPISSVGSSLDSKQIISGGVNGELKTWDATTGQLLQSWKGSSRRVLASVFSIDGKTAVTASASGEVSSWNVLNGQEIKTFPFPPMAADCARFNIDAKRLILGSWDTLRVLDLTSPSTPMVFKGHIQTVNDAVFSLKGDKIASVSDDATLKIWEASAAEEFQTVKASESPLKCVASRKGGSQVAAGGGDNLVRVWTDENYGNPLVLRGHSASVNAVAFSPRLNQLVSGSSDKTLKLWDATTGAAIATLSGHLKTINCVAYSPDGRRIASGSGDYSDGVPDNSVRIWDSQNGQQLLEITGHSGIVTSVVFGSDGKTIFSAGWDNVIRAWDANTGKPRMVFDACDSHIDCLAVSADGKKIVSGGWDKVVAIWDAATGRRLATLYGHSDRVESVAFSGNGKRIISVSNDRMLKLWESETGQEMCSLSGAVDGMSGIALSADGTRIVSAGHNGGLVIWQVSQ